MASLILINSVSVGTRYGVFYAGATIVDPVLQAAITSAGGILLDPLKFPFLTALAATAVQERKEGRRQNADSIMLGGILSQVLTGEASAVYGDGSDGALTFDGTSTVLGLTPSGGVYTLTRDIFATSMTVAASATVKQSGFRVFGTGALANLGTMHINGNAGGASSAGTGGAAGAATNTAGSLAIGTAGGAGASGNNNGSAGTNTAIGFPGGTGAGGAGGAGNASTGGAAGTWAALAAGKGGARYLMSLLTGQVFGTGTSGTAAVLSAFGGGSGGGGGGGDNADAGGGGGGGGGGVGVVAFPAIVNSGVMSANGGAGSAGTSAANNAGGGGGGGGGVYITVSRSFSGNAPTAVGGAGGAKVGASGVAGSAGTAGQVIQVAA